MKEDSKNSVFWTQFILLAIIQVIFCFTPLGNIQIIEGAIPATTAHLPAIVAALFLGRRGALAMGGIMAVRSVIWWSLVGMGLPASFLFIPWAPGGNIFSLIISILPKVIFPYITAIIFTSALKLLKDKKKIAGAIAGFIGTLSHSIMLLGLIYIIFDNSEFFITGGVINAIIEIILGTVIGALAVSRIGLKRNEKRKS